MEGISQEAIALAGHLKLNQLIVLFDDNGISIDGPLSLSDSVDQVKRFEAAGWARRAHRRPRSGGDRRGDREGARAPTSPTLIACKTTIGFGAPTKAGKSKLARLAARRRRDQGRAREARLERSRRSRFRPTCSTHWRAAGQRSQGRAQGLGQAARRAAAPTSAPNSSAACAATCRARSPTRSRAREGNARRRAEGDRDPQGLASSRSRALIAGGAGDDRRLGRPHRLQQHPHQGDEGDVGRATMPAASSTTASASTAWPRR